MNNRNRENTEKGKEVTKPYITGQAVDNHTAGAALKFFGTMIVVIFITFIACSSAVFSSVVLRYILNLAVIAVTLMIYFNFGSNHGAEAVTRGEILFSKQDRGQNISVSERKACYHRLKGFLNGFIGTIPFLVPALILAFLTTIQTTEAGALPSWMQSYTKRSDIGKALIN